MSNILERFYCCLILGEKSKNAYQTPPEMCLTSCLLDTHTDNELKRAINYNKIIIIAL